MVITAMNAMPRVPENLDPQSFLAYRQEVGRILAPLNEKTWAQKLGVRTRWHELEGFDQDVLRNQSLFNAEYKGMSRDDAWIDLFNAEEQARIRPWFADV